MEIKVNSVLKERFVSALQERFGGKREGVHVSDLVYCLREAFYRKTDPVAFTERQLGFFVDGARRHKVLQELLGVESEVKVERFGVRGSVDLLLEQPVEIKTTRARASLPDHYFKQLGFYAVMLGTNKGYLVVQRLNPLSDSPWEFYYIEWPQPEMIEFEREMKERASLLVQALENKEVNALPRAEFGMGWKCAHCLYRDRCQPSCQT